MSVDWAAEMESTEADLNERIRGILEDLRNNEQVLKAISDYAEQTNLPPDLEQVIKDNVFSKEEQARIIRALAAQEGKGRRRKTRKTRRKHGKRISSRK
jgi:hypothetical protein